MLKIPCNRNDIEIYVLSAGHYFADAGAAMGVLPYKLWGDKIELDPSRRIKLELNCLFVKTKKHNIVVDCGIGDFVTEKQIKIYQPSRFTLLDELSSIGIKASQIDMLVLTHLHFDHAGGVLSQDKELVFKNAKHVIQIDEWETALNPDSLNMAAYHIAEHYKIMERSGVLCLVEGENELSEGVFVEKTLGHCPGMQIVKIKDKDSLIYFCSDAFPLQFHLTPSITSAYDISRKDLHKNKEKILKNLKTYGGKLIFSHEIEKKVCVY